MFFNDYIDSLSNSLNFTLDSPFISCTVQRIPRDWKWVKIYPPNLQSFILTEIALCVSTFIHSLIFFNKYLLISDSLPSTILDAEDTTGKAKQIKSPSSHVAFICWFHGFSLCRYLIMELPTRKSIFYNSHASFED